MLPMNRILANRASHLRLKPQKLELLSTKMVTLDGIIENNKRSLEIINCLRNEITAIRDELATRRKRQLIAENAELRKQIELARGQLIALETRNGKKQFPVPGARTICTDVPSKPNVRAEAKVANEETKPQKAAKEKKPKKEKPTADANSVSTAAESPVDVGRLDMRVGRIVEISHHPDADSLYLEKVDCGEPQPRTVISGLVRHVPLEEMQDRLVVVLCNLKPAKMRGITSEAMIMCASTPEKVEVLSPPAGAVPGDLVYCEGYPRQPDVQLNPKKKIFETCAPDLKTNDELVACYKGAILHIPGKGAIAAQTLKNVQIK